MEKHQSSKIHRCFVWFSEERVYWKVSRHQTHWQLWAWSSVHTLPSKCRQVDKYVKKKQKKNGKKDFWLLKERQINTVISTHVVVRLGYEHSVKYNSNKSSNKWLPVLICVVCMHWHCTICILCMQVSLLLNVCVSVCAFENASAHVRTCVYAFMYVHVSMRTFATCLSFIIY